MKNEDMLKELGKYFIDKRNKMDDRLIIQLFLVAYIFGQGINGGKKTPKKIVTRKNRIPYFCSIIVPLLAQS